MVALSEKASRAFLFDPGKNNKNNDNNTQRAHCRRQQHSRRDKTRPASGLMEQKSPPASRFFASWGPRDGATKLNCGLGRN